VVGAAAVAALSRPPYQTVPGEPDRPWEYGGTAMRLRLGRARLLGGLVGAWEAGQGR
jgi:hypothetical protein